jgi:transposase
MTNYYLGGDISKSKIDFCFFDGKNVLLEKVVDNTTSELKKFIKLVRSLVSSLRAEQKCDRFISVFEYTGDYNNLIKKILLDMNEEVSFIHPGALKAVVKIDRNKTDKADARNIAEYGYRFCDKLEFLKPADLNLDRLKVLMSARESYVRELAANSVRIGEQKLFLPKADFDMLNKSAQKVIKVLKEQIREIEEEVTRIIKSDPSLKEKYDIIKSVPGLGPITAAVLICFTGNFTRFESAKQLGSYCGVVPFERSSGVFKGKRKVSQKAHKGLKTLLHMCALSTIQRENIFAEFYERKVKEGKNKMSAINSVRNKLIKTVFSCVKNKKKFDPNYLFSFAA